MSALVFMAPTDESDDRPQFSISFLLALCTVVGVAVSGWQAYWPLKDALLQANSETAAELIARCLNLSPIVIAPLVALACLGRLPRPFIWVSWAAVADISIETLVGSTMGGGYWYAYVLAPALLACSLAICLWSMRRRVSILRLSASCLCGLTCGLWVAVLTDTDMLLWLIVIACGGGIYAHINYREYQLRQPAVTPEGRWL
ncbi:MAG: hypothetical protein WD847_02320 [Pirellulales bacterium]